MMGTVGVHRGGFPTPDKYAYAGKGAIQVDWALWQAGHICRMVLGDLGADVLKIEHRVIGDPSRG